MKVKVAHQFYRCDVDRFIALYFSEAFNEAVAPLAGLKSRERVEEETLPDGKIRRRVKMRPAVNLPKIILRTMPTPDVEYFEVSVFDPDSKTATYRVESAADGVVDVHGVVSFRAIPGGVERAIDGEVNASVPAIGFVIERLIRSEVTKRYDAIEAFTQSYIDDEKDLVASSPGSP